LTFTLGEAPASVAQATLAGDEDGPVELSIGEFARTRQGDPDDVGQAIADAVEAAGAPDNYALVVVDLQA
jgi:hypothetical protein